MRFALAIALALLAVPAAAVAAPGELDPTFGSRGKALFPVAPGANNTQVLDAAVRPDGKIVLVGVAYQDGPYSDGDGFVAQLNADGSLDGGFGTGGVTVTPVNLRPNGTDRFTSVTLASGGVLVVAGDAQAASGSDIVVGRYRADGQPDAGFGGGDGLLDFSLRTFDTGNAVGVLADGSPVAAGSASNGLDTNASAAVTRVRPDGSGVDPAFGSGGTAYTSLGGARIDEWFAITVRTEGDDTVTVAGGADMATATTDFMLGRFDAVTGMPDQTFGGGSFVTPGPGAEIIADIALYPDGSVLVAGQGSQGNVPAFQIASYTATGQLNSGFDGDGQTRVEFPFPGVSFAGATGVAIAPDGRIAAGGFAFARPFPSMDSAEYALAALRANGELDFKITHDVGGANDFAAALEPTAPDAALLAGTSFSGGRELASAIKVRLADEGPPPGDASAPPPATATDLRMVKEPLLEGDEIAHVDEPHPWVLRVYNDGPAAAKDVVLTDTLPAGTTTRVLELGFAALRVRRVTPQRPKGDPSQEVRTFLAPGTCRYTEQLSNDRFDYRGRGVLTCRVGDLEPGQVASIDIKVSSAEAGERINTASVTSATPDSKPGNEKSTSSVTFVDDRSVIDRGSLRELERQGKGTIKGQAKAGPATESLRAAASRVDPVLRRLAKVEVALVRVERGAKPAQRRRARCRWLRSRSGRFVSRKPAKRRCDKPVWLRAKGTARWSYRISRRLPRGRYVIYSRTTNRGGASEGRFSAKSRNRFALRLR